MCSWQSRDSSETGVRKLPDGGPFQYRNPVKRSLTRTCCQPSRLRRRCGKLSSSETVQSTGRRQELRVGGQNRGAGVWRVYLQMEMVNVSVEVRRIVVGTAWGVRTFCVRHRGKQRAFSRRLKEAPPWMYLGSDKVSRVSDSGAGAGIAVRMPGAEAGSSRPKRS